MAKKTNKKLSYKISLPILAIITLAVALIIYASGNLEYGNISNYSVSRIRAEHSKPVVQIGVTTTTQASTKPAQFSLDYLFDEKPVNTGMPNSYSNIVGYFAHGAFAWYVPGWIDEDWLIKSNTLDDGLTITPKKPVANNAISNIVLTVSTSTETYNAATLFEFQKEGPITRSEVLLNKHTEGGITIIIETNTRIYHVQKEAGGRITDLYFMDGNGKTLSVSFSALKDYYPTVAPKIRDMIEGIGEIKAPQG